jgi:hypothetical protein
LSWRKFVRLEKKIHKDATRPPPTSNNGNGSLTYTVDGTKTAVTPPASTIYINEVSHNAAKATVKIKVTIFPMGELFDFVVADKDVFRNLRRRR